MTRDEADKRRPATPGGHVRRPAPSAGPLRRAVRDLLLSAWRRWIAPARRRRRAAAGRQIVVVLCYHRVDDELRDNITVGVEQFDRQMAWVAARHPTTTVDAILRGEAPRNADRPVVAVTFDDGYLDNYTRALPVLDRHGVPATFYVSTGMIGTDRPFQHDLDNLGRALPTMSWEQLRELRDRGFGIGSHTVTHVNLARVPLDEARRELADSRDELRDRLDLGELSFAYCFGGPDDITPATRGLVRELGYAGCLSAYGGVNRRPVDPFDVRRVTLNCGFSMAAFKAYLEGWGRS